MSNPESPKSSLPVPAEQKKTIEDLLREQAPEVLRAIPIDKRSQLSKKISMSMEIRSGPLPSPKDIAAYNEIIPQGADRIMRMAEKQSAHRIEMETLVIGSQQTQATRGQVFALIIALFSIVAAAYCGATGQPWLGGVLGGATLVSLVSAFLVSQKRQREDLEEKAPEKGKNR